MLDILSAPEGVAGFKIRGPLTREDVDRAFALVDAALAETGELAVCVDVVEMTDVSAAAVVEDLHAWFKRASALGRYKRKAVIARARWMHGLADVWTGLGGDPQVKVFAPGETAAAMAWAAGGA